MQTERVSVPTESGMGKGREGRPGRITDRPQRAAMVSSPISPDTSAAS